MHAVVVEVDASGAEQEEALGRLRDEIVPQIKQAPGFQSGTWLMLNQDAKGLGLVLFDSEENAQAAASRFAVGESPQPGVTVERNEVREVAVTA
jgi:hypothetical protein